MHKLLFVAAVLMLVTPALAQPVTSNGFETGDSLFSYCGNPERQPCTGYVTGIADVMASNAINGLRACIPLNITKRQAVDVARAFLTKHPNAQHFQASALVAAAFAEAWPCPK
jgi:hypothetical protein